MSIYQRVTMMSILATAALISIAVYAGSGTKAAGSPPGRIGDPAPALEIASWVAGEPVEMVKGSGANAYLIEFWATWCPQCDKVSPKLSKLQKTYGSRGLSVIAISDEEPEVVKEYVESKGSALTYTVAVDNGQRTTAAYMARFGLNGIPAAFLVNGEGKIAWVGHPADPALDEQIAKLLPAKQEADKASGEKRTNSKAQKKGGSGSK